MINVLIKFLLTFISFYLQTYKFRNIQSGRMDKYLVQHSAQHWWELQYTTENEENEQNPFFKTVMIYNWPFSFSEACFWVLKERLLTHSLIFPSTLFFLVPLEEVVSETTIEGAGVGFSSSDASWMVWKSCKLTQRRKQVHLHRVTLSTHRDWGHDSSGKVLITGCKFLRKTDVLLVFLLVGFRDGRASRRKIRVAATFASGRW